MITKEFHKEYKKFLLKQQKILSEHEDWMRKIDNIITSEMLKWNDDDIKNFVKSLKEE